MTSKEGDTVKGRGGQAFFLSLPVLPASDIRGRYENGTKCKLRISKSRNACVCITIRRHHALHTGAPPLRSGPETLTAAPASRFPLQNHALRVGGGGTTAETTTPASSCPRANPQKSLDNAPKASLSDCTKQKHLKATMKCIFTAFVCFCSGAFVTRPSSARGRRR